ncbi:putative replication protein [Rhizobium phage RHph_N1_15]|nr:putative replication protein [Rhizobium phage RHph_N1_10]QIG69278.1 putative replication protein [Rhizobium phage RHph_N1_15]QIG75138.1 putative replication protein [Rhizobium phage RHph_N2_6]
MAAQSTGWRGLRSVPILQDPYSLEKQDLFDTARIAARVLKLPASARFVLDQLCGVYNGEPIDGRILVWPSNEFLVERTGIPERSIRFAIARLIEEGIVISKDSPNGKRFAQRSASGQIVRAFGFDLSPLLARRPEFVSRLAAIKEMERERSVAFDELTIHRRSTQEALRTLAENFPSVDIADLTARALELVRVTPRRSGAGSADPYRGQWQALRQEAESRYYTASAGNNCRHKDNNKYAPDQSCNNGYEDVEEATPAQKTDLRDLKLACPDAMEFMGEVRHDLELVAAAGRMRGSFGVSPSAWEEARREIGPLAAAATLVWVIQIQARPSPGADQIKNFGGYFRAMCRLIRDGRVDLNEEIRKLRRQ